MRARLVSLDGGPSVEVVKDMILIGRREDCDLKLEHKSVSKIHCIVVKADGLLLLRDLGSTNGTRVNNQRVRRAALLPNDVLHVASVRYKVQFGGAAEEAPADGYTQQMDAGEVAKLLAKKDGGTEEDSIDDLDMEPVRANLLPDVYPADAPVKK